MTPSDRLAEIETTYNELFHGQGIMSDDVDWLIARVKRLTEALELMAGNERYAEGEHGHQFVMIARKALSEENE